MNHWTNLHCKYGEEIIFENVQLDWQEGEQIGFWGCSGCGKTSLLKEIARRLEKEGKKFSYVFQNRSEEHTSELQSRQYLVCRLLLEKKKNKKIKYTNIQTIQTHTTSL